MRKALIVGINYYEKVPYLSGCVTDAERIFDCLERHGDESPNFIQPILLLGENSNSPVPKNILKDKIKELFEGDPEIALFYFAGHGCVTDTGGYICASDTRRADGGIPLSDIMIYASNSKAKNKIIILDSCHSGILGASSISQEHSLLKEGTVILTASTSDQTSQETSDGGMFTNLLIDGLNGAAANLVGEISPGSLYAHIDKSLGPWDQRPVFKTNVKSFVSLRKVSPPISTESLRRLPFLFEEADSLHDLDASYEPDEYRPKKGLAPPNQENNEKFVILQQYNRVNLAVPVDANHMWDAAMESKSCKLTELGKHYWKLAKGGKL